MELDKVMIKVYCISDVPLSTKVKRPETAHSEEEKMAWLNLFVGTRQVFDGEVPVNQEGNIVGGHMYVEDRVLHLSVPNDSGGKTVIKCGIEGAVIRFSTFGHELR